MLRYVGAAFIRAYQRHLSPRKGYRCAYGVLHGAGTCSSIGLNIMEHQGFWAFWRQMPLQFDACRVAAQTLKDEDEEARRKRLDEERRRRRRKNANGNSACNDPSNCDLPCNIYEIAVCEAWGDRLEFDACDHSTDSCDFGPCHHGT